VRTQRIRRHQAALALRRHAGTRLRVEAGARLCIEARTWIVGACQETEKKKKQMNERPLKGNTPTTMLAAHGTRCASHCNYTQSAARTGHARRASGGGGSSGGGSNALVLARPPEQVQAAALFLRLDNRARADVA
jgi:hypothetical protein